MAEEMWAMQASIQLAPGDPPMTRTTHSGQKGLLFKSDDRKVMLQCRVDGMTVSRLRPYTSFGEVFEVFAECWSEYQQVARPSAATRIALRYINRFEVPPQGDLLRYLNCAPTSLVAKSQITTFTQKTTYRLPDGSSTANVITALEAPLKGMPSVVVDVDAWRTEGFDMTVESLQSSFYALRDIKNQFFFSAIGAEAEKLFL